MTPIYPLGPPVHFYGLDIARFGFIGGFAQHPFGAGCLPNGYKMLGGGARVELPDRAEELPQGSLITALYPPTSTSWEVRAKDHIFPSGADVRGFCIAARALDEAGNARPLDEEGDDSEYRVKALESPVGHYPSQRVDLDRRFMVVGGGAIANWEETLGAGSLLHSSYPMRPHSWFAAAKDHEIANETSVTTYVIGLATALLERNGLGITVAERTSGEPESRPSAECRFIDNLDGVPATTEHVLVSGGARIDWDPGAGSLLTASYPGAGGVGNTWIAAGKDHAVPCNATITSYAVFLYKLR
jgi:hypothetical protein